MYFMYVDESGDPGLLGSQHYILSAIIIPAADWRPYLTELVNFRRYARLTYGLSVRDELHAAELIRVRGNSPASYRKMTKQQRIRLYEEALMHASHSFPNMHVINVSLDKKTPKSGPRPFAGDVEEACWGRLIERYNRFLQAQDSTGLIFADQTNEAKLRKLLRKMRAHHYVPSAYGSKGLPAASTRILEDPNMRVSSDSFFVQLADLVSHALYRKQYPKGSLRRFNVDRFFDHMDPRLVKAASRYNAQGIVVV